MKTKSSTKKRGSKGGKAVLMKRPVPVPVPAVVPAAEVLSVDPGGYERGAGMPPILEGTSVRPGSCVAPVRDSDPGEMKRLQEAQEKERQGAFRASGHSWKGRKVWPLAIDREGDFYYHRQALGLLPLGDVIGSSHAFMMDAVRMVWFCLHEPETWLEAPGGEYDAQNRWRAYEPHERALQLEAVIRVWAKEHVLPGEQQELVKLAYALHDEAYLTEVVPAGGGSPGSGGSEGNAPGQ